MKYKVGDRVVFNWLDHCINRKAYVIASITPRFVMFKGIVQQVKTHDFFIFKKKFPQYKVCGIWVDENTLKPLITLPAII